MYAHVASSSNALPESKKNTNVEAILETLGAQTQRNIQLLSTLSATRQYQLRAANPYERQTRNLVPECHEGELQVQKYV
jgi:hypothetical protein